MILNSFLVLLFISFVCGADPRNVTSGTVITSQPLGYFDQPQIVMCPSGTWVCVMTANLNGREGAGGEHISSSFSSDNGTTWSPLLDIEPPSSIAASYASTFITPKGRIYTVFTYNADNITSFPNGKPLPSPGRTDQLGHFKLKYSDDCGQSWSDEMPVRPTAIDRSNNWNGSVLLFWTVSKPLIIGESVYIAFTKIGEYFMGPPNEIFFLRSDNALNATDPSTITWVTLPEGDAGISAPTGPGIAEESHIVELDSPDHLWVNYRTDKGFIGAGYSLDAGNTWTTMWNTYEGGPLGRPLKNPRAPIASQKISNGFYLFLFFNNAPSNEGSGRNPYWLAAGRFVNGTVPGIEISQPEIYLYVTGTTGSPGYPDIVEINGNLFVTETDKGGAVAAIRVSPIDNKMSSFLFSQWDLSSPINDYSVRVMAPAPNTQFAIQALPNLAEGGGFTILTWLAISPQFTTNATILDTRNSTESNAPGIVISTGADTDFPSIGIFVSDGSNTGSQFTDSACSDVLLDEIAFIVDGGPKVISVVVDGILCDGGLQRSAGWSFFGMDLADVTGSLLASVGEVAKLGEVRIYNRYLLTSEVISNWRAGMQ